MKKISTLFLALVASISLYAQSGTCGPNLTWILQNGVLTISGSGNMNDYSNGDAPWYSFRESISSVIIDNSVTSIGDYAFYGCSGLTSVTIPNSVTSIGSSAFRNCSGLTSVTIPNSVTSIGRGAFYGCSGLTSITIPNSVTSIGDEAFHNCSGLTSVTIGNSVTSIGDMAFYQCSGLTSVTIGNSVINIGDYAFLECSGLTSITIPNSVTSIGELAFSGCSGLTSISVESGNTHYDSRNSCNAIIETSSNTLIAGCKNTIIPNSVTSIGNYAFEDCSGLTSITIPNSVTSIGRVAFGGCSGLTSVVLGSSLRVIEDGGFYACDSIESFTCYSVRPPSVVEGYFTYRLPYSTIVYAPAESLSAYQVHDFWGRYDVRPLENSALEDIFAEHTIVELLANPATQVFTLQGNDVSTQRANLPTGTYILRLGNKAGKVVIP